MRVRPGAGRADAQLHENRHDLVGEEHSVAGQAEASSVAPQAAGLDERLEIRAEPAPDVNPVARLYGICVDSVNQPQSGEQGVPERPWRESRRHRSDPDNRASTRHSSTARRLA